MARRTAPVAGSMAAQIARLNQVRPGKHRVISCYLKVEPRDRARGKYLIKLKNRVKAIEQALPSLGLDRATAEAVRADLAKVVAFLKQPGHLPATQGIAIFASGPLKLWEVVPLPTVHRSRLSVDRTPLVRELASTEDEFGRILTAVLDRTAARFFQVTAGAHRSRHAGRPVSRRPERARLGRAQLPQPDPRGAPAAPRGGGRPVAGA